MVGLDGGLRGDNAASTRLGIFAPTGATITAMDPGDGDIQLPGGPLCLLDLHHTPTADETPVTEDASNDSFMAGFAA